MFESNTTFLLSALSLGFATVVYVFYGPKQSTTKRSSKNRSKDNGVNGLYNYGNQCFINAILQSLSSLKSMNSWLKYANGLHNEPNNSLTDSLLKTINVLNNKSVDCVGGQSSESLCSPINVLNALKAHKWTISNEEQDSFELFNVMTQTLESELYSSLPVYSLKDALLIEDLIGTGSPQTYSPAIQTRGSNLHPSPADNRIPKSLPTKGMLCSQLYCRKCCHKYPLHLDRFDAISLVMPNNVFGIPIQLHDCLNKFVSNEVIHEVRCETCIKNVDHLDGNSKSAFVKKLTFAKMPDLLCLHIQRLVWLSNGHPLKRCENIIFPEYLDMDSYVYQSKKSSLQLNSCSTFGLIGGASIPANSHLDETTDQSANADLISIGSTELNQSRELLRAKYKYKLRSVIVHLGDASTGHFICYRRGTDTNNQMKWFYISDTTVLEVNISEVLNSSAYMLFYERISNY